MHRYRNYLLQLLVILPLAGDDVFPVEPRNLTT